MRPLSEPAVRRARDASEVTTREGCAIAELSNFPGDPEVSIARARARVRAGATTRWHALVGIRERYVILEGRGRVEIGELPPREVVAGDVVLIPDGCRQRIAALGDADLVFLAICSPRFEWSAYLELDAGPIR